MSDPVVQPALDVVVVTHFFPAHGGGIELVAARLVDEFLRTGLRVEWYASATDTPPSERPGLLLHPVAASNVVETTTQLPYPLWTLASLPPLWRSVGRARAVHVHEHLYFGSILGIVIGRLRGKRVVITQHMGALNLESRLGSAAYSIGVRALAWPMMNAASYVAFVSANVRGFFSGSEVPFATTRALVFNGLDDSIFYAGNPEQRNGDRKALGLAAEKPVAIFAGRFVRKKGLHLLHDLAAAMPDVTWIFAGSGPENPATWRLPNVRPLGRLDQRALARAYRAADVLVLPSTGEGFPLVVQEALACGAAVLSTDEVASACPDATGLIHAESYASAADDIVRWERRLRLVLELEQNPERRRERAARAAGLWSWERCAATYVRLLGLAPSVGRP